MTSDEHCLRMSYIMLALNIFAWMKVLSRKWLVMKSCLFIDFTLGGYIERYKYT